MKEQDSLRSGEPQRKLQEWFMKSDVFLHSKVLFCQHSLDIRYTQGQALTFSVSINICDKERSSGNRTPFRHSLELNRLHLPHIFVVCTLINAKKSLILTIFYIYALPSA